MLIRESVSEISPIKALCGVATIVPVRPDFFRRIPLDRAVTVRKFHIPGIRRRPGTKTRMPGDACATIGRQVIG